MHDRGKRYYLSFFSPFLIISLVNKGGYRKNKVFAMQIRNILKTIKEKLNMIDFVLSQPCFVGYRKRSLIVNYIYLINQARGPYWENIGSRS